MVFSRVASADDPLSNLVLLGATEPLRLGAASDTGFAVSQSVTKAVQQARPLISERRVYPKEVIVMCAETDGENVHPFIRQMFTEYLPCIRPCARS